MKTAYPSVASNQVLISISWPLPIRSVAGSAYAGRGVLLTGEEGMAPVFFEPFRRGGVFVRIPDELPSSVSRVVRSEIP